VAEPRFLFDSNACIYVLEGLSDALRDRVESCRPGEIVTSAIVYAEVVRGLDPSNADALEEMERLFVVIEVLPFDGAAAQAYAQVPFNRGRFDRLIAAHALALGLTIVTSNASDFSDVPGLRVEDWTR